MITVDPEHEERLLASDVLELSWEKYAKMHKVVCLHNESFPELCGGLSAKPLGGLVPSSQAFVCVPCEHMPRLYCLHHQPDTQLSLVHGQAVSGGLTLDSACACFLAC